MATGNTCSLLFCFVIIVSILTGLIPVTGKIYMNVNYNAIGQGKISSFVCLDRGTGQPVTIIQWFKNRQILRTDSRMSKSPHPLYNKLTIKNVRPSDSGEYMCVTSKGLNATQYLVVYCPIVVHPQSVTRAVVGGNATLRCDGKCYDYIVWAKNYFIVDSTEPERFYSPGNGSTLYITNVSMSDNGSFQCEFISLTTVYTEVKLMVIEPANRVTASRSKNVTDVGHDYELRCECNGNPPPDSVTWYNNSKPIRTTNRVTTRYDKEMGVATLSISPVTRYDGCNIECRFKQELAAGQFSFIKSIMKITPTGKPDPPTDLKTDVFVFSDSLIKLKVRLSWTPPTYTGNLDMLAYLVTCWDEYQCERSQCSRDQHWLDGSVVSHQFDLKNLLNATHLCFSVQSVNIDGLSVASDVKCVGVKHFSPHASTALYNPTGSEPTTQEQGDADDTPALTASSASRNSLGIGLLIGVSIAVTIVAIVIAILVALCIKRKRTGGYDVPQSTKSPAPQLTAGMETQNSDSVRVRMEYRKRRESSSSGGSTSLLLESGNSSFQSNNTLDSCPDTINCTSQEPHQAETTYTESAAEIHEPFVYGHGIQTTVPRKADREYENLRSKKPPEYENVSAIQSTRRCNTGGRVKHRNSDLEVLSPNTSETPLRRPVLLYREGHGTRSRGDIRFVEPGEDMAAVVTQKVANL